MRHRTVSVAGVAGSLAMVALAIGAWGCATTRPAGPGWLSVEVQAGQPGIPTWPAGEPHVELVLDLTASSARPRSPGVSALDVARGLAVRWLRELPEDTPVTLHAVVGSAPDGGERCAGDETAVLRETASPAALSAAVTRLAPRGEASTEAVLRALADRGAADGTLATARVVLISDFDASCAGDLCAAAGTLLSGGATLDLVAVGASDPPACLADALLRGDAPAPIAVQGRLAPPPVRVVPAAAFVAGGAVADRATASGIADGAPFSAPGGEVFVRVELSPPYVIGPIGIEPGKRHRLQVLDFPAASPPVREWHLEREPAAGAAPLPGRERSAP